MKRILLVEDSLADVELIGAALEQLDFEHEVRVLRDGAEALAYCDGQTRSCALASPLPDVVLLDLKMPRVDGFEVLQRFKHDAALRSAPIVVLSASFQEEDVVRAYELGANGYVVKNSLRFLADVQGIASYWCAANAAVPVSDPRTVPS